MGDIDASTVTPIPRTPAPTNTKETDETNLPMTLPPPMSDPLPEPIRSPRPSVLEPPFRLFHACLALNAVQRVLSAAVLAPSVTYFLWQSPAFATATVCSCLQSLCSYEFAWLAHRIHHRLLRVLPDRDATNMTDTACSSHDHEPSEDNTSRRLVTHGSDDALAILQSSHSLSRSGSSPLLHDLTPALSERPLLETPPATPPVTPRHHVHDEADTDVPGIDPTLYAVSPLTAWLPSCGLKHRLAREWLIALIISTIIGAITTVLFLLAIETWLPQLENMEIYRYRVFYAAVTNFIGMLCACFSPNWRYAIIVFGENIVFTVLTMYSTVCPINQFSCGIVLEPLQAVLVAMVLLLILRFTTSASSPEAFILFVLDALGFLYIVGTLTVIVAFVDDDKRALYRKLLIVLLYVTWASDTGAYVTGKMLALCKYPYYHPLAAHLSKNKDYEGTLGAVLWGLAAMFLASHILSVGGSPWTKSAFTIVAVVIGRFGDLFESLLKRAAGVKDSGSLIPGHGGVLDRIDALMFVTLVFARYYTLVLRHE